MFLVFGLMTCFRGPVHRRLRHGLCNAPFEDLEHAINAVRTGREFQERAVAVSARWEQKLGVRNRNGVGINTGAGVRDRSRPDGLPALAHARRAQLWQRLLGRPASEEGEYVTGTGPTRGRPPPEGANVA